MKRFICISYIILSIFLGKEAFLYPHDISFSQSTMVYGSSQSPFYDSASLFCIGLRLRSGSICYFDTSYKVEIGKLSSFFNVKENSRTSGIIDFANASLNFPSMNAYRISFSLFFGEYDKLGSDSVLHEYLKREIPQPEFLDYYPAKAFSANIPIKGFGFALYGSWNPSYYAGLYSYWNNEIKDRFLYTNVFRFGGHSGYVSFDTFFGLKLPKNVKSSKLSTGITGYLDAEKYGLYFQAGFADFGLKKEALKDIQKNFYAFFEPRINGDFFNASFSFFMAPVFILPSSVYDEELKETNYIGFNSIFAFGSFELNKMRGGLSLLMSINPKAALTISPFSLCITPFYAFSVSKCRIEFRIPVSPLEFENKEAIFKGEISIKAEF